MRNAERKPQSGTRNGVSGSDAESERSDKSDRTWRFGHFFACDAASRKKAPWVLLLRIVKEHSTNRTP